MTETECIEQLRDAPGDEARWAVYADLLQARGDLRGELIALSLRRKTRAERLFRKKHHAALGLATLLELVESKQVELEWEHGHLASMTLQGGRHRRGGEGSWAQVLRAVMSHPLAVTLRRVRLASGYLSEDEASAMVALLVEYGAGLNEVSLLPEMGHAQLRAGPLLGLPRLVTLSVANVASIASGAAPRLRELNLLGLEGQVVTFEELSRPALHLPGPRTVSELGTLELPQLRSLMVRAWADTQPALSRWFREGCRAPQLRRLALEVRFTSQIIDAVADAPFAKTLETLSVMTMDESSAEVLLRRKADLPRLTSVVAHHQRVPLATEQRLRAEFPG
jgi:uncharacterized protein (TIGR02996 family)